VFVADHLAAMGWRVLDRNWHGVGGELDLVVLKDGMLRFVEVKARILDSDALESITASKRRKLVRTAEAWLLAHREDYREMAFLVAVVTLDPVAWTVLLLDDAFDVAT